MSASAAGFHNDKNEFEIKSGWIRKKFPSITKLLTLKTDSFCLGLKQQNLDKNSDPETWIASPYQKQHQNTSILDGKLDQSSFFTIAALKKRKTSASKNKSTSFTQQQQQHSSSGMDPSASEEHGVDEDTNLTTDTLFPMPARSLFSAHKEVVAAFSAGQRRLQQKMSVQQRRASIAEAQRERQAHMELLEQHFGRRFLRKAMTIVEENDTCVLDMKKVKEEIAPPSAAAAAAAAAVVKVNADSQLPHTGIHNAYYDSKQQELATNIHAQAFNSSNFSADSPAAVAFEENEDEDESYFYIDFDEDDGYSGSGSFLQHTRFAVRARSSTDDLETVAAVF